MEQRDGIVEPPALSNATPPCKHFAATMEGTCIACGVDVRGIHALAAPPVAEGPAATPRDLWPNDLTMCNKCRREVTPQNHAIDFFGQMACLRTPAAAEPPVARAAADLQRQLDAADALLTKESVGYNPDDKSLAGRIQMLVNWRNSLDFGLAQNHERAQTAERQLDEARRELADSREWHKQACEDREEVDRMYAEAKARIEGLTGQLEGLAINRDETLKKLKRVESAEAANQELRQLVAKLAANMHCDAFTTSDLRKEAAALLGPQHGDAK